MVNPRPAHLIEPDRWAYIVNPVAGNGRAFAISKELALAAGAAGFGGPVQETLGPGHATDLAASAVRQGANIIPSLVVTEPSVKSLRRWLAPTPA